MPLANDLETRFREIRESVPSSVTLVAVSKIQATSAIEALYGLGHRDFGENYVQELLEKARELEKRGCPGIRWHFIGHLQSNKVKSLLPFVYAIHSVDSTRLAQEISKRAAQMKRERIPCFLSVNIDREPSKSGFTPEETKEAAEAIAALPHIDLRGLMCIPAPRPSSVEMRVPFQALRELEKSCRPFTRGELSMGMSDDFESALLEGSTSVRVGSRIFGSRKPQ